MLRRIIALAMLLSPAGCGVLLQTAFGWHSETAVRRTEQKTVQVSTVPAQGLVQRVEAEGPRTLGLSPVADPVSYEVEETISSPRVGALLVGAALEAAATVGLFAVGAGADESGTKLLMLLLGGLTSAYVLPEFIVAGVFAASGDTVSQRRVVEKRQLHYLAQWPNLPAAEAKISAPDQLRAELVLDPALWASAPPVAPAAPLGERKIPAGSVVAVMEVEDMNAAEPDKAVERGLVRNLGDQLRVFVTQRGAKTVDRGSQDKVLSEQIGSLKQDSYKSCYDDACQIELGKALAASHILRSRITRFGARCVLNAELVDLRSEVIVAASSAQGSCEAEGFLGMSDQVAAQLLGG